MSQLAYEQMRHALDQLNMPRALESVDALLDRAGNNELSVLEMLNNLLGAVLGARRERSITMRLKLAGLPGIKTMEQFDFGFQPSLDEGKIRDLHTLRFLEQRAQCDFPGSAGLRQNALEHEPWSCRYHRRRDGSLHHGARIVRKTAN